MELEIEASTKAELEVTQEELNKNLETITKFKKDVAKFLVTTEKWTRIWLTHQHFLSALIEGFVCILYAS